MAVLSQLLSRVSGGDLTEDAAQIQAAKALDAVLARLERHPPKQNFFTRKWSAPKGLYMWGGVGRGKSMLMDWFYDAAPIEAKARVHFHAFMLDIHARIHAWRQDSGKTGDPIVPIAKAVARQSRLLCFDEFHVTDITDAMILSRLFEALWDQGVVVVATSNREPQGLYKNGLNRPLFEPFIEMMPEHMIIHEFAGDLDHRLRQLTAAPVYYSPLDAEAERNIDAAWARLTSGATERPATLTINARDVVLNRTAAGVVRTSFHRLCADTLGAADYLQLAHAFQTLILENVPQMGPENRNEAKRFVTLVDALYETRTKLIISAAVEPQDLYPKGDGSFEFERTISRLIEMRSEDYLGQRSVMGEDVVPKQ